MGSPPTALVTYSNDEIVIEWWFGPRKLTVWTSPARRGEGLRVWGPDIQTEMELFDAADPETFRKAWAWLTCSSIGEAAVTQVTNPYRVLSSAEIEQITLRLRPKV